jgi:hypothetical protein
MGISTARHSYGTLLQVDPTGAIGTPSGTWNTISEVVDITGPGIEVTSNMVTNLSSPNAAKEKIAGLIDAKDVTFTMNFNSGQYNTLVGYLRLRKNWKIVFPLSGSEVTNATIIFIAHITKLPISFPDDNKIACDNITLDITGLPTYSPAA